MNTEQERYRFEAWAVPHFMRQISELYRHGETESWPGQYDDYAIQCAWEAWQARGSELKGSRDYLPMPESTKQARAMILIGTEWLKHNPPEKDQ